jgi:hypothetical protein
MTLGITIKVTAITLNNSLSETKTLSVCQLLKQYRLLQLGWVLLCKSRI